MQSAGIYRADEGGANSGGHCEQYMSNAGKDARNRFAAPAMDCQEQANTERL